MRPEGGSNPRYRSERASPPKSTSVRARSCFATVRPVEPVGLPVDAAQTEIFDDEVILDPVLRTFPPYARFLHAAEGRDFGGDDAGVDADDAVFERLGDAPDAVDVAPVEVRGEAEFGVVGELDRFFLVLEAEERRDRAEGFFPGDFHAGV